MLEYDNIRLELEGLEGPIDTLKDALHIEHVMTQISELESRTQEPDFWNDVEKAQHLQTKLKRLQKKVDSFMKLCSDREDLLVMCELCDEAEDAESVTDVTSGLEKLKDEYEKMRLETLLTGEYDKNNAILTLHAGAGGTEAQDWVEMLYRMYSRWAERHRFKVELLDYLDGEEAGIKSASILIKGENSYGFLKSENGVHRLVRVSPFDASGRRHTSFASLEVMPEIDENTAVDIRPEDVEMEVYRSSGAGGQKVNKTSSAVRLIHKPTGIVCACQTQRSQVQNREYAMRMLKSKLIEIKEREHLEKVSDI